MRRWLLLLVTLTTSPLPAAAQDAEALFAAVRAGDLAKVRSLIASGLAVDTADKYGNTALAMAASSGQLEVARYLLDEGADPNRRETFYGTDPLGQALFADEPRKEIAALLLEHGAENREMAFGAAVRWGDLELARAAVEGGPFFASRLAAMRENAGELDAPFQELLARARSRPDPEPPRLTPDELRRFTGSFEGFSSDTKAETSVRGDALFLSLDGGEATRLVATGERAFRSEDSRVEAYFFGRAGTIEGLNLRRGDAPFEELRQSVAEPVEDAGLKRPPRRPASTVPTVNWPAFRGANAAGIGDGVDVPVEWNLESGENVLWQTEIPRLGNSSPVVWGDRVFLTTAVAEGVEQELHVGFSGAATSIAEAVEHRWLVLAFDKHNGRRLWQTEVGRGVPRTERHQKASQANPTPATDGGRLAVVFPTAGLACLDLDGAILWRHDLGPLNASSFYDPDIQWGFASSPVIYGSQVILQVDVYGAPYLAAWDLETGKQLWKTARDVAPSWATPTLLSGPSGDELVVNGSTIHGYDPETGRELWSLGPTSELVISTPVAGDGVVYVSAGYPPVKPIYALRAGTRGDLVVEPGEPHERLVWSHELGGAYMPTPLLYRGLFYVVHYNGRLVVYDAATGTPIHKSRFSRGGTFTGSPVAVNGKLYLPTEEGLLYVRAAEPDFEELAVNDFGEPLMATPAVSEGVLFVRTPSRLVAIGAPPPTGMDSLPLRGRGRMSRAPTGNRDVE